MRSRRGEGREISGRELAELLERGYPHTAAWAEAERAKEAYAGAVRRLGEAQVEIRGLKAEVSSLRGRLAELEADRPRVPQAVESTCPWDGNPTTVGSRFCVGHQRNLDSWVGHARDAAGAPTDQVSGTTTGCASGAPTGSP